MTDENKTKIRAAVGPLDAESPTESPTGVPALSWVYVMSCQDRTKIGLANDVALRKSNIEMAIGMAVDLHGSRSFLSRNTARRMEIEMHRRFADRRLLGEWFAITPNEALEALDALVPPPEPERIDPATVPDYADLVQERALQHLMARAGMKKRPAWAGPGLSLKGDEE